MASPQQTLPEPPITDLRLLGWPNSILNWLLRLRKLVLEMADGDIFLADTNSVVVTDNSGEIVSYPAVSTTEVSYLNGVTSGIQSQINNLQSQIDALGTDVEYTILLDDTGTYLYVGEADPGTLGSESTWRIKRVEDDEAVLWANGTSNFDKTWDDRATYSYS